MKILAISLGISFLIISGAVTYYLVIFIPEKERAFQEIEKQKIEAAKKEKEEEIAIKSAMNIYCQSEAAKQAIATFKSKSELVGGDIFKQAAEEEMYFKDDYNEYFESCINKFGF